jgi:hypothetical protein
MYLEIYVILLKLYDIGECEGDEDGYEEEYPLESLELLTNDFIVRKLYFTVFFMTLVITDLY